MIFTGPFQLGVFYDSINIYIQILICTDVHISMLRTGHFILGIASYFFVERFCPSLFPVSVNTYWEGPTGN